MKVHPSVLQGFGDAAEAYERARPSYPADAVDWLSEQLGLAPGSTVVDLAAGTGKLTRLLVPTGATVIAVEPVDAMRDQLEVNVPGAQAVSGYAEEIPLADGVADAVTVAQAFHWFATDEALSEIARVLRPAGRLGLIWNRRKEDDPLQTAFTELVEPLRGTEATHKGDSWREVLEPSPLFGPLEQRQFENEQQLDADGLAERAGSISFIASASPERRAAVVEEVRALAGGGLVRFPYVTDVYVTERS